jgi:hypothetical protein
VQKALVPPVPFFIGSGGSRFIGLAAPAAALRALLVHSVVMPRPELALEPKWGLFLSAQQSAIGSSGSIGLVATVAWLALLAAGVYALAAANVSVRVRAAIAMTIAGQFLVYLAYGEETFLYATAHRLRGNGDRYPHRSLGTGPCGRPRNSAAAEQRAALRRGYRVLCARRSAGAVRTVTDDPFSESWLRFDS